MRRPYSLHPLHLSVKWIDAEREPRAAPNPTFPNGVDVDLTNGALVTCQTPLDYPAPRCGAYVIECERCGQRVIVTTAGRRDDPRSVRIACERISDGDGGRRRSAPVR
jgi:hypothetical protein